MAFVTSYPGLLTPAFVTCSTNAGKGLVKLSHVVWRTWTYGGVAHSFCTAVKRLSESDVERSVVLWSMFAIGNALAYLLFSRNVPLLHTSRYVIPRLSFTRPSPVLVSNKRWGEKAWVWGYGICTSLVVYL